MDRWIDMNFIYLKEAQGEEEHVEVEAEEEEDERWSRWRSSSRRRRRHRLVSLLGDYIRKPEDTSVKYRKGACTMCVIRNII